jgi:hypothetical protein
MTRALPMSKSCSSGRQDMIMGWLSTASPHFFWRIKHHRRARIAGRFYKGSLWRPPQVKGNLLQAIPRRVLLDVVAAQVQGYRKFLVMMV